MTIAGQSIDIGEGRSVFVGFSRDGLDEDVYIRFVNSEQQKSWLRLSPEAVYALSRLLAIAVATPGFTVPSRSDLDSVLDNPLVRNTVGRESYSGLGEEPRLHE